MADEYKTVHLVRLGTEDVEVDGRHGQKIPVNTVDGHRTLFFVFKSDDIDDVVIKRLADAISKKMPPDPTTSVVVFALSPGDDFDIHELKNEGRE